MLLPPFLGRKNKQTLGRGENLSLEKWGGDDDDDRLSRYEVFRMRKKCTCRSGGICLFSYKLRVIAIPCSKPKLYIELQQKTFFLEFSTFLRCFEMINLSIGSVKSYQFFSNQTLFSR